MVYPIYWYRGVPRKIFSRVQSLENYIVKFLIFWLFLLPHLYSIEYNEEVLRSPAWVLTLWEVVSQRWKKLISFCNFESMPLIVGNWILDITPDKPKRGQKSIGQCVCLYVCTPLRFATICLRATKFET